MSPCANFLARHLSLLGIATLLSCLLVPTQGGADSDQTLSYFGGVSERILTVPDSSIMAGYGVFFPPFTPRARRSTGTLDPLKVQVFALKGSRSDIVALVGIDAIGLRFSTVETIKKAIESWDPFVRVVMNASHSHATPDSFGLWGELPNRSGTDPAYLAEIEGQTIAAIREAVTNMKPVSLSTSEAVIETWNSALETLSSTSLTWFWMEDLDQKRLLGSWTHWNAHPTILPANNTLISADYVGFYRAHLAKEWGDPAVHSFANGFLAAEYPHIPVGLDANSPFDYPPVPDNVESSIRAASGLGLKLAQIAKISFSSRTPVVDRSAFSQPFSSLIQVTNTLFRLAMRLDIVEGDLKSGKMPVSANWLKIGPYQIVALPGEPSRSVADSFTDILEKAGVEKTLVIGQSGGMIGYLLNPETEWPDSRWRYQKSVSTSRATPTQLQRRFEEIFWWKSERGLSAD